MRKMFLLFGMLAMVGVLFVACTDEQATGPEEAAFAKKNLPNNCLETDYKDAFETIKEEIKAVYSGRQAERGALQIVDNIGRKVCSVPQNLDATPAMAEGFYDHVVRELEDIDEGLHGGAFDLVRLVFDFALQPETPLPVFPPGAFQETGVIAVVVPGIEVVVQTPNLEAALVVDPESFGPGAPVTMVLTRISDDLTPIPGFTNFAERYQIFASREPSETGDGVLVALCVPDDQDLPDELAIGHYNFRQVEILVPVDPGDAIDCTNASSGYTAPDPPSGLVILGQRLLQPVLDRVFGVKPLNAMYFAGTGLGGRTKSFSPFVPVDPTILVGETVQLTVGTDAYWSSGIAAVATVDTDGLVTGVTPGTATITALVDDTPYDIDITVEAAPVAELPFTCAAEPAGGDRIFRGFHIPEYPGSSLAEVTLHFSADVAGTYTLSLTALPDDYDGGESVLGIDQASVYLEGRSNYVATSFAFNPVASVTPESTIAFRIEYVDGPVDGGTTSSVLAFYKVPSNGDPDCPVVETNGTSPPLDSWRRDGVWITVLGTPGV